MDQGDCVVSIANTTEFLADSLERLRFVSVNFFTSLLKIIQAEERFSDLLAFMLRVAK